MTDSNPVRQDDGMPLEVRIQEARYAMLRLLRADAPHERLREQWSKLETLLDTPTRDGAEGAGEVSRGISDQLFATSAEVPTDSSDGQEAREPVTSDDLTPDQVVFLQERAANQRQGWKDHSALTAPPKPAPDAMRVDVDGPRVFLTRDGEIKRRELLSATTATNPKGDGNGN